MTTDHRPPARWAPTRATAVLLAILIAMAGAVGAADAGIAPPAASGDASGAMRYQAPAQRDDGEHGAGTLTWSVRPTPADEAPDEGADRSNYTYELDAGAVVEDSIRVRNFGPEALPLMIYASDGLITQQGELDLLPAEEEPVAVGTWVALPMDHVVVPPGEHVDIPFTVTVPADIPSGDHAGGILTSFRSESTAPDGDPVVLDRRLGNRMHIRVSGSLRPELAISDMTADYDRPINPFGSGTMEVGYTVTNTGNVRLGAEQLLVVDGWAGIGSQEAILEPIDELLPGSSLTLTTEVPAVWPTFRTRTSIELTPVVVRDGDVFDDVAPTRASVSTTTIPIGQLVILALVVGVPVWRHRSRRRRQRAEDHRIQTAVTAALAVSNGTATDASGSPEDASTEPTGPSGDGQPADIPSGGSP